MNQYILVFKIMITIMITIIITIAHITTATNYSMLKGIRMIMIVLLMKSYIESSQDISFVFFLFWIALERI